MLVTMKRDHLAWRAGETYDVDPCWHHALTTRGFADDAETKRKAKRRVKSTNRNDNETDNGTANAARGN